MKGRRNTDFEHVESLQQDQRSGFSHEVNKVRKKYNEDEHVVLEGGDIPEKYWHIWYSKKMGSYTNAVMELIAQEFFRLLIPSHPKTRLVLNGEEEDPRHPSYITSKQVPGFKGMHEVPIHIIQQKLNDGTLKFFGDTTIAALWLNEGDYKFGNLGVDKDFNATKIDGNNCFILLQEKGEDCNFDLSKLDLNQLPYVPDNLADNWLDIVRNGELKHKGSIIPEMYSSPFLGAELNRGLLKIITMSDALIRQFVQAYLGENSRLEGQLVDLLIQRRDALEKCALRNGHFRHYLKTQQATEDLRGHVQAVYDFQTTNKRPLLEQEQRGDVLKAFSGKLKELKASAEKYPDYISLETRKVIARKLVEFINQVAVHAESDKSGQHESKLKWSFASLRNPERVKQQHNKAVDLMELITDKEVDVDFDNLLSVIGAMMRHDAAMAHSAGSGKAFGKGKFGACFEDIIKLVERDREDQLGERLRRVQRR